MVAVLLHTARTVPLATSHEMTVCEAQWSEALLALKRRI